MGEDRTSAEIVVGAMDKASGTTGSATNYSYSVAGSYNSSNFSAPSFSGSPSTGALSGGTDASDNSALAYSYSIPSGTGYAPDGDVIGVSDSVMGDWAFSYDAQNRLYSGLAGTGPYNTLNLAWSYDRYGNRWGQTATGNPPTGITMPTPPHFTSNGNPSGNVNNHVDGYNYDAAGDVTADSLNQYAYDGEGRLCAAYSGNGVYTEYIYNAEGQRVAKGSASNLSCNATTDGFAMTNRYIIGPTGEQLSEMNGSGGWLHTNVFAGGKLLATYGGTDTYFALTDWLGTKRVETDSAGSTVSASYSLPFGDNLVVTGGPDATEHHFTGKEHDPNTGNDYFLARYYNSATGRFLSPDWSKNPEGVPYADFSDPQTLNLYTYVLNNPLVKVDPDGHIEWKYLKDKFKQIFYAKVSVGVGVGGELKLTKNAEFKAEVKAGVETRATLNGERTVLKIEAGAGAKLGKKEVGKSASVEMQVEKDGKVSVQKPTFECCTMSAGSDSTQVTASGNDIGIGGHEGSFGGEVGIDVDKAKEFGQAVKQQVNDEIQNDIKKILPN